MHLEIITPDKKVFRGEVSEASFPGASGAFQVLKNHAPLIAVLVKGLVSFQTHDEKKSMTVDGGVVEVRDNEIILLAEKVLD